MEFKDYYKILGVKPDAGEKEIKTAYRKLARQYHPDVSEHSDAEDKFKEVSEAYNVLGDTEKRAEYDEIREYGGQGKPFEPPPGWTSTASSRPGHVQYEGDFSDFFSSIFGAAGRGQGWQAESHRNYSARGRDVETEMPVFLEETVAEQSRQISFSLPQYDQNGRRLADVKKTLKVKIPAGVSDGQRIRLKGKGTPGIGEGAAGDLYLRIRLIPHPLFDVEGHNLVLTTPLAPWEAALGTKFNIPTLTGKIRMTIPPNSQSGQRLRVKGKGLLRRDKKNGDLFVVLKIVNPPKTDDKMRGLWKELAEASDFEPRAEWR